MYWQLVRVGSTGEFGLWSFLVAHGLSSIAIDHTLVIYELTRSKECRRAKEPDFARAHSIFRVLSGRNTDESDSHVHHDS